MIVDPRDETTKATRMSDAATSRNPSPGSPPPIDTAPEHLALSRTWAYLLSSAAYVPVTKDALEQELRGMVDAICAAVGSEPFDPEPAQAAGSALIALNCTHDDCLKSTMDVLGKGLLALREFQPVEKFAERIVLGLGALARGYAEAHRERVFEQQEAMKLAMLKAVRDARWNLRESEARFDEVVSSSTSGIMITDLDGRLIRTNTAIQAILGYSASELTELSLFDLVHPDFAPFLGNDYRTLLGGEVDRVKQSQRLLRKDGDVVRVSLTASLLRGDDDRPNHFVTVVEDGTELALLQNELSRQALHDVLTGLPNRQYFGTHLERAIRKADPAHGITLFHLGLDAFAMVADGLGRKVGEQLLVNVARRLKAVVHREKAMVARFEGDEFGILVENGATTPEVATIVESINRELAEPIYVDGHGVAVQASAGVVHRPSRDSDPVELLRTADFALRRATAAGRGQWELYQPEAAAAGTETYALAASMPGAWETGQLSVIYRPEVSLVDRRITGVEALLRWDHPDQGVIPHDRCVDLAERTGLILSLGEWLMRTASRQVDWWRRGLGRDLPLIVGLSGHQSADAGLRARIERVLDDTGLLPEHLVVGMPVTAVTKPGGKAVHNLAFLAGLGVRTMIDDFGTAPDELTTVEDLPVRAVRVARRLVERRARAAEEGSSVLSTALGVVPALVHGTETTVLVDGVHTREDVDWWRQAGADAALGDYFAPPGRADYLAPLLSQSSLPH